MTSMSNYIYEYKKKAQSFKNEEEVRIGTNTFLEQLSKYFGFSLRNAAHEITSAFGGRADSMYSDIIFEYKTPDLLFNARGVKEVIDGRDNKDRGLRHYLVNFSLEECINTNNEYFYRALTDKVGIGFNGRTFVFARYIVSESATDLFSPNKTKDFPSQISNIQRVVFEYEVITDLEYGFKKLMLLLRSTNRMRLSSIKLLQSFGPKSDICQSSIHYLYETLSTSIENNLRVSTLFDEWNRIFGDVYGEKETDFTEIKSFICNLYSIEIEIDLRKMLFTIQTYYNIILKLLVFNLLNSLKDPTTNSSLPHSMLKINQLFSGQMLSDYKIENFFENHFFEWFIYVYQFKQSIVNDITLELEKFETTASIIRPEMVEDVFREVYDGFMPREVRHLLGEYYTPGWLVEFALDEARYFGDPNVTLLDPACGSGSFITHAIKRFKEKNKTVLVLCNI